MDNFLFLQHLREGSLEEGRAYIQEHIAELADHDVIGDMLADDALKQLYNPFVSLKLAELLIFFGEIDHHVYSHALGLKAKGEIAVLLVEQYLEFARRLGDRYYIMERGSMVQSGKTSELTEESVKKHIAF